MKIMSISALKREWIELVRSDELAQVTLYVFGAEVVCASCVNMPTAKETFEWLEAALPRRFSGQPFQIVYIDIDEPQEDAVVKSFVDQIEEGELFYPLIVLDGTIVGEGNPRLKDIVTAMKSRGYIENEEPLVN